MTFEVEDTKITTDAPEGVIFAPHLGITLRVLLSVAADAAKTFPRRTWKVSYKNTVIGTVRIKDTVVRDI